MLNFEKISVRYGGIQALWDVSLHVAAGEIVVLLGANGSGKTTAINTISGLLRPSSGSIEFENTSLRGRTADEIVGLGLVQVPEGRRLFPLMTVEENLLMGGYHRRHRSKRREGLDSVYELLPVLKDRRRQLAGTLSGGEQQMVAMGRGLVSKPKLLMLDEPSIGLAPSIVRGIFQTIRRIRNEGTTVLLVEQNVRQALSIADRGYVLETGRLVLSDSSDALLDSDLVRQAYLGL